ncbi:MAG: hypothetical protein GY727_06455 [Gammaproteobacteria bacterium]|nr:hypothetical protein [Gammaproteobacteria bacterium]MCP4090960.1 hypothetical protein [Gammaproteobacteria bacterium]MCP4275263.1 hypothetical protein [Gammaproteobacteria bacterium]MCP4929395.1 hypothetical protein [Gammaproteobacteria bacterium]
MPTAHGAWVPVLDGSGWERFSTEDGVMRREFKGIDDDLIARQAEQMRNDISAGKNPEGGNVAFHMPAWLLADLEKHHKLDDLPMPQRKKWWKDWESTQAGRKYKVRGI